MISRWFGRTAAVLALAGMVGLGVSCAADVEERDTDLVFLLGAGEQCASALRSVDFVVKSGAREVHKEPTFMLPPDMLPIPVPVNLPSSPDTAYKAEAHFVFTTPDGPQTRDLDQPFSDGAQGRFKLVATCGCIGYTQCSELERCEETAELVPECKTFCGNDNCDEGESCFTCTQDCGECPICGDHACNGDETCGGCPQDCSPCCGDGTCDADEGCDTCADDCGKCPVCGDGECNGSDTCSSCPEDCSPCCGDGECNGTDTCSSCPKDCSPCCGDGVCNAMAGETCGNCLADCKVCCGDGTCDPAKESSCSCAADCADDPNTCSACECEMPAAPGACACDASCTAAGTCCANYSTICPVVP